ncbi:uncharacterized protein [Macrobrachium rosenbergii]|uniref:uncharacterized protein isoform X1 n=1 Tax=Macrobrachium rosenbergii TaxID=79674 RepID=UPI0034D50794
MAYLVKKTIDTAYRQSLKISGCSASRTFFTRNFIPDQAKPSDSIPNSPAPATELKWLFPASKDAEEIYHAHRYGSGLTGTCHRYNTKLPLQEEHVARALDIWQRKIPSYSCCIKERDNQLWICQDPNPKLDFEVLEEKDRQETIERFSTDAKGSGETPLWKARLIRVSDDSPCVLPELKEAFPYQYDLILSLHHCFMDGFTSGFGFQKLVEILNDVIAGRPLDNQPLAMCVSDADIQELNAKIRRQLEEDPVKLQELKEDTLACNNMPVLLKAFPPPGGKNYSKTISHDVKQHTLQKFYAYCKSEGVTFNSGFEALINTALVEMIRDAGVNDESHQISVNMAFDMRRYMKQYELPIVGLNRRHYAHRIQTHVNIRNHFWTYTRMLHDKLSRLIKSGEVMQQYVVRQMTMPQVSLDDHYKGNPPLVRDYALANIGDITKIIPGEGEHLQMTNSLIFNSIHKSPHMMLQHIFTFRGHSPYSLSYNRNSMSDDTAGELMDRVVNLLENFPQ